MFQSLSDRLGAIFDQLKRKGVLTTDDVSKALREVRIALLEADVALPVVKQFIADVQAKAVGKEVLESITPGQMVVKMVNDQLVQTLGGETQGLNLATQPPAVILMAGLQGSGKTTSTGKLARHLTQKMGKKVLMASLDVYRPAAQQQLKVLGESISVDSLPIIEQEKPKAITERALTHARKGGYDVLILDTAGRLHIDQDLMDEVSAVHQLARPIETLFVADAMMGQEAATVAKAFHDRLALTGIILTRMDGDARGGAALSMRHVTGTPIKFIGVGEKADKLEVFHPSRMAERILGMGDIVSLVEKAAETLDHAAAEKMAKRMQSGVFDLNDLAQQLEQMQKMGGMSGVMNMLPGVKKMKDQMAGSGMDDKTIRHQLAIIRSMTPKERKYPTLLNASRKRRIAAGAGVQVPLINRLLKQFEGMGKMMKKMKKMEKAGRLKGALKDLFS